MAICDWCPDRGMCCRYVELPLSRTLSRDEAYWVSLHPGISVKDKWTADGFVHVVRIETACSALDEDGLCSLFGKPGRPEMCVIWPDQVEEQAPEGCAYLRPPVNAGWVELPG